MRKGLADALDMLTVCVEAGQGFDAAILQVARASTGPISGEFARVLSEMQIGKSRGEAFACLGERTTAPEVKTFVSALVQADRLGLPIAVVLREQTKEMRIVRRQRAEETGSEGHRQDPLPAAAVHLSRPLHRHHRTWRHPDRERIQRGASRGRPDEPGVATWLVLGCTGCQRSTSATRPSRTAAMTALARLCAPSLS